MSSTVTTLDISRKTLSVVSQYGKTFDCAEI